MHGDALDDAGVVDEDVDGAHLLMDFLHEGFHVVFLGHVAHIAFHVVDSGFLVVVESALKGGLVDVVENDGFDTGSHESLGDVETDTIGCARNPGVLPLKREWICCH